jgi:arginine exporter protein ArgO
MYPSAMTAGPRRSLFGDGVLLVFLAAQVCDGALTYVGVHAFGLGIEANPIVGFYIAVLGAGYALIATKVAAVACAALLHLFARHRIIGVLTILYLAMAVRPWVHLLVY